MTAETAAPATAADLPALARQARSFSAKFELERRQKLGILTDDERERLSATAERWWREVQRLNRLPSRGDTPSWTSDPR